MTTGYHKARDSKYKICKAKIEPGRGVTECSLPGSLNITSLTIAQFGGGVIARTGRESKISGVDPETGTYTWDNGVTGKVRHFDAQTNEPVIYADRRTEEQKKERANKNKFVGPSTEVVREYSKEEKHKKEMAGYINSLNQVYGKQLTRDNGYVSKNKNFVDIRLVDSEEVAKAITFIGNVSNQKNYIPQDQNRWQHQAMLLMQTEPKLSTQEAIGRAHLELTSYGYFTKKFEDDLSNR